MARKKRNNSSIIFIIFILVAILVVILLEYIDFKDEKKSVIFPNLIPVKKSETVIQSFSFQLMGLIKNENVQFSYFMDKDQKHHLQMSIPNQAFDLFIKKLKKIVQEFKGELVLSEIQRANEKISRLYQTKILKQTTHYIVITQEPEKSEPQQPPPKKKRGKPKIAFIIDDVGNLVGISDELKKLQIPITASILADTPNADSEARKLRKMGLETMIHVPMQPKNTRSIYSPREFVTLKSTDNEIRDLLKRAKQIVPHARGTNNHEGSLITANQDIMNRFFRILKKENLFFVDSRTTIDSQGYQLARKHQIKTAFRDVFLDHVKSYDHSMQQIRRLVNIALEKGTAISIGHPLESTFSAIEDSIPYIRSRGIEIVFVSEILE